MRTDAKRVMYTKGDGYYSLNIEFVDGRVGSISGYMYSRFPFMISVAGKTEYKAIKVEKPFWPDFTKAMCNFFLTKEVQVDHRESLAIMAIRSAGLEAMKQRMSELRNNPPKEIAGIKVVSVADYQTGVITKSCGCTKPTGLPKSNMLFFNLENGDSIIIRPSGTEPKIKHYYLVSSPTEAETDKKLEMYKAAF